MGVCCSNKAEPLNKEIPKHQSQFNTTDNSNLQKLIKSYESKEQADKYRKKRNQDELKQLQKKLDDNKTSSHKLQEIEQRRILIGICLRLTELNDQTKSKEIEKYLQDYNTLTTKDNNKLLNQIDPLSDDPYLVALNRGMSEETSIATLCLNKAMKMINQKVSQRSKKIASIKQKNQQKSREINNIMEQNVFKTSQEKTVENYLKKSYEIFLKYKPSYQSKALECLRQLGKFEELRGEWVEAQKKYLQYQKEQKNIKRVDNKSQSQSSLIVRQELALIYFQINKYKECFEQYEKILDECRKQEIYTKIKEKLKDLLERDMFPETKKCISLKDKLKRKYFQSQNDKNSKPNKSF